MSRIFESTIFYLYAVGVYLALPAITIWGWMRWAKRAKQTNLPAIVSLAGFAFATTSGLLAISTLSYARAIGGFPFYDPRLLRIYRWGSLLSLSGIVLAISGVWRPSRLRWHALGCSFGTLLFWVVAANGE